MTGTQIRSLKKDAAVVVGRLIGSCVEMGPDITVAWVERDGARWWGLDEATRIESGINTPDRVRAWLNEQIDDPVARRLLRWFGGIPFESGRSSQWWLPACLVTTEGDDLIYAVTIVRQDGESDEALHRRLAETERHYRMRLQMRPTLAPWVAGHRVDQTGDRARWNEAVTDALRGIAAGEFAKVVHARSITIAFDAPPVLERVFETLVTRMRDTHRFFLRPDARTTFLGASPELLFDQVGQRLHVDCLAGTAPRGDEMTDDAFGQRLLASAKDRHEHAVVVDFVRKALLSCTEHLTVPETPQLTALPNVWHLYTPVDASRPANEPLGTLIEALHPTPAVCGQPREAARAWIHTMEATERGWYAGVVGWVSLEAAKLVVGIRSATATGNIVQVHAGAGLVLDSEPESEWLETARKAEPLVNLMIGASL